MPSTLVTAFSWLSCTWDRFLSFVIVHHLLQRNNLTANVANVKYQRLLPFLLHLAGFLASGMGFFAEWCTFLFKEITYSDFYQHGTYKWLCPFSLYLVSLLASGIGFFAEWCTSLYKEKWTVNFASWTQRASTLFMIFSCPSCSVVLFPKYTRNDFSRWTHKWVLFLMSLFGFLKRWFLWQ